MADYSGYAVCAECGRDGDARHPITHKDTCSVPGKLAKAARRRQLDADAARERRIEQHETWDAYDDDQLVKIAAEVRHQLNDLYTTMRALEENLHIGIDIIKRRKLLNEYLDVQATLRQKSRDASA